MSILLDLWTKFLEPYIKDPVFFWPQLIALILISAVVAAFYYRKALAELVLGSDKLPHDIAIFKKLDTLVNESTMDDLVNRRIYTNYFHVSDDDQIASFIVELTKIESRYLDEGLQEHARALASELDALLGIVRSTFWNVGEDRLKFRPDPMDREVVDREWKEVCTHIDFVWHTYRAYRTAVKDKLHL